MRSRDSGFAAVLQKSACAEPLPPFTCARRVPYRYCDPSKMNKTEHRLPLDSSTKEFLIQGKFKVNESDPGEVYRTYCSLDYLMEHLEKEDVKAKVVAWRQTLAGEIDSAFA